MRRALGYVALAFLSVLAASAPTTLMAFVHPLALAYDSLPSTEPPDATTELHCLALNIYHEARGESVTGKFAVGQVTINRVRSARYPNSICRVVWQRAQFSWTRDGRPDRPRDLEAWNEALWVATIVRDFNPYNAVGGATHYHAVYVRPSWSRAYRRVRRIGRHIFYEQPKRS